MPIGLGRASHTTFLPIMMTTSRLTVLGQLTGRVFRRLARIGAYMTVIPATVVAQTASAASGDYTLSGADIEAHFQSTYIWQHKAAFDAPYTGEHSLLTRPEHSYTFSATAFFGVRLRPGTELYIDPEVIQGTPISGLYGLGSPTNGEIQKVAGPTPLAYLPRVFLRQTWQLGGTQESVASSANQMAGIQASERLVLSVGKMAVTDVFDLNTYAHDPRTQFMTWASLASGPYDFVADAQGYTWGGALEYFNGNWALRAGRFIGPKESNGQELNFAIGRFHGDQVELEHHHEIDGHAGAVRLLGWRNVENMGRYDDAMAFAATNGGVPDVGSVRRPNVKHGWGLHIEQALSDNIGGFARYGWANGQTETYSFEEVDRSAQFGLSFNGALWRRAEDAAGVLLIRNGLSSAHRAYLAQGGLGFFIGDGQLNYRQEQVLETYYNVAMAKRFWLGLDVQHIANPAYNADRGPVNVYGIRLHAEY